MTLFDWLYSLSGWATFGWCVFIVIVIDQVLVHRINSLRLKIMARNDSDHPDE